jgi:hypothetical protein
MARPELSASTYSLVNTNRRICLQNLLTRTRSYVVLVRTAHVEAICFLDIEYEEARMCLSLKFMLAFLKVLYLVAQLLRFKVWYRELWGPVQFWSFVEPWFTSSLYVAPSPHYLNTFLYFHFSTTQHLLLIHFVHHEVPHSHHRLHSSSARNRFRPPKIPRAHHLR